MQARRRRAAGTLIAGGAMILAVLFSATPAGPAVVQALFGGAATGDQRGTSTSSIAKLINLHFYEDGTTKVNPLKMKPGNFGLQIKRDDPMDVQYDTESIRENNPFTTAAHMAQMGWVSAKPEDITSLGEQYKRDTNAWEQALDRLFAWENDPATKMSIEDIPGPYATYYEEPGKDAESVVVKHDSLVQPEKDAKMMVYRNGNTTIMRALNCELQPIAFGMSRMPDKFPTTTERTPPSTSTPPGTGDCTHGCSQTTTTRTTTTTTTPNCYEQGECKSTDPKDYPYPSGKPKVTETHPADTSPPAVTTTRTRSSAPAITPNGPIGTSPVNPGASTGNGSIPASPGNGACNPKFEQCPTP